jgi:xanthine dehydrogenase YagS FAD-binding subunit
MRHIERDADGNLWIGASVHLDEFINDAATDAFPAVKQAIQGISSIQLQSQGTLGGELLRRPTCWYFRDGHGLLAEKGRLAVEGDNRYHAILGNRGAAKFVSASRLAPALISLAAQVRVVGPEDEEYVPLEALYRTPRSDDERENALAPNQLVTHIILPPVEADKHLSAAYEVRHGEGPDQPLAAAAATMDVVGGIVSQAKIVLGQVAPIPWVSTEAASAVVGNPIMEQTAEIAGVEALASALPLSNNEYKIQLAQVAVKRAILRAAGMDTGGF